MVDTNLHEQTDGWTDGWTDKRTDSDSYVPIWTSFEWVDPLVQIQIEKKLVDAFALKFNLKIYILSRRQ